MQEIVVTMDVLLNTLSIFVKEKLQSLYCMMGKTMSLRCHLLTANSWRWIASFGASDQPYFEEALFV